MNIRIAHQMENLHLIMIGWLLIVTMLSLIFIFTQKTIMKHGLVSSKKIQMLKSWLKI